MIKMTVYVYHMCCYCIVTPNISKNARDVMAVYKSQPFNPCILTRA